MPLNLDCIGQDNGFGEASWSHRDAMLYALGVGARQDDPPAELQFTTENSIGVPQQVLPGFGVVLAMTHAKRPSFGDVDTSKALHGEQSYVLHRPLPAEGRARVAMVVAGIYDTGRAALLDSEITLTDLDSDELLLTTRGTLVMRGEGGFGGSPAPATEWRCPDRGPDVVATTQVRSDQALLYGLSGDRNPLHSDPTYADKGGFDRPILHGMCTHGITERLLVNALCGGNPDRVRGLSGRFTRPVMPGTELSVRVWVDGDTAQYQTVDADDHVVLDRGSFVFGAVWR